MLIGFIVVIVMILVIVGLMATGNTGGGTGINQTKATKVVTEIGTIAQSLSFFKTTTAAGDMSGFTHADGVALLDGYSADGVTVADDINYTSDDTVAGNVIASNVVDGVETEPLSADMTDAVKSQAVPNLLYAFAMDANNTNRFVIDVVLGTTAAPLDSTLADVLGDTISSKLNAGNMIVNGYGPTADVGDPYAVNSVLKVTVQ
jgi:hypothetical protein